MTQQIAIFVGDHEIDLIDAEKDDEGTANNSEVWAEIDKLADNQVFRQPKSAGVNSSGTISRFRARA